jgi:hypothetical protein
MTLTPQDQHHLLAAEGWLELGDWLAANEELEEIEAVHRGLPSVLALRIRIYCAAGKWEMALVVGNRIASLCQDAEVHLSMAVANAALSRVTEAVGWLESALNLNQTQEFRLRAVEHSLLASVWSSLGASPSSR